jgi:hypothetical protein
MLNTCQHYLQVSKPLLWELMEYGTSRVSYYYILAGSAGLCPRQFQITARSNLTFLTGGTRSFPDMEGKGKGKVIHYRSCVVQRVGRGIAVIFHDRGTRRWVSGQQHAPVALYPRERPGTHFTGGWVCPRAGVDGRKISSPPGFDPVPSSP